MKLSELVQIAKLATITVAVLKHSGSYTAEEVNQLLERQRQIIASRIMKEATE